MEIFKSYDVIGHAVDMKATNPKHFGVVDKAGQGPRNENFISEFAGKLNGELGKVNEMQLTSDEMTQKLAVTPDEVSIADVMVASQKAQLALSFTKTIRDKLVTAFQALLNMR